MIEFLYLLFVIVFIYFLFKGFENAILKSNKKNNKKEQLELKKEVKSDYDIVQLPNGKFSPTYKGQYCYLFTSTGQADTFSSPTMGCIFDTKEQALKYLENWKSFRGLEIKSMGL